MTNELVVQGRPLATDEIELIKNTIAVGASDNELALFIQVCNRTGLDPFARQIYSIRRDGRMVTQTSIDGFRLIAQRSGDYAGQTPVWYCGEDRQWTDLWLPEDGYPKAAKVGVYRTGFVEPLWATATWDQYVQTNKDKQTGKLRVGAMWNRMPALMLGKCAESLALRKAFPQDLSGLYTEDEMGQAGNDAPPKADKPASSRRRGTVATTPRSAPASDESGEAADQDDKDKLANAVAMFKDDAEREQLKDAWKSAGLPPLAHMALQSDVDDALRLVFGLLNAVDGEVQDAKIIEDDAGTGAVQVAHENLGPPLATDQQVKKINAMLGKLGFVGAVARYARLAEIVGHEVKSSKNLTKPEASKVIDQLEADEQQLR